MDEIKELMDLLREKEILEFELERDGERIRIRRGPESSAAAHSAPAREEPPPAAAADASTTMVEAPIIGTFYEGPSPDAAPFVQVGDRVEPGQVLCIIEAMKLMNEIEADTAGVVVKRFVSNGQPVEYGEALFAIQTSS
jgi:acetyl-CoA carboxylase biotin carboxyl carrier protein